MYSYGYVWTQRIGLFAAFVLFASASWSATITVKQDGTGDFTRIQAAVDAAEPGDIIEIHGGVYEEDVSIGHLNMPPLKKDNITLRGVGDEDVRILLPNQADRVTGLPIDFGESDILGVFINGDGVTLENLFIEQPTTVTNQLSGNPVAAAVTVISSNVTIRNCDISGSGVMSGDIIGVLLVNLDAISAQQGTLNLARNFTLDHCRLSEHNFAFASNNFLSALGVPAPDPSSRLINSMFEFNGTGVEMDDGVVVIENCLFQFNGTGVSVAEHEAVIRHCRFEGNTQWAIELETGGLSSDAPDNVPTVLVADCFIIGNGTEPNHAALRVQTGEVSVVRTTFTKNVGVDVVAAPNRNRNVVINVTNCDFYKPGAGVHYLALETSPALININTKNSIFVGENLYNNQTFDLLEEDLSYSNFFLTGEYNIGELILGTFGPYLFNDDPMYVDPENNNFYLQPNSPLVDRADDGGPLGRRGVATPVTDWELR